LNVSQFNLSGWVKMVWVELDGQNFTRLNGHGSGWAFLNLRLHGFGRGGFLFVGPNSSLPAATNY